MAPSSWPAPVPVGGGVPDIGGVLGAITCKLELSATSVWSTEDGVLLCISLDSPSLVVFSDALALFISAVFCVASLLLVLVLAGDPSGAVLTCSAAPCVQLNCARDPC